MANRKFREAARKFIEFRCEQGDPVKDSSRDAERRRIRAEINPVEYWARFDAVKSVSMTKEEWHGAR